jgi:hypothetical protein
MSTIRVSSGNPSRCDVIFEPRKTDETGGGKRVAEIAEEVKFGTAKLDAAFAAIAY